MLDAAERAGVTHLVGHEFRFAPERAVLGRAIADGRLGDVHLATLVQFVSLVADPQARTPGWWFDPHAGGGWLGASGSHVVDQVRAWLGDFAEVSARLTLVSARVGVAEDSFTVRFRLLGGVDGVLVQTAAAWGPLAGITRVGRDARQRLDRGQRRLDRRRRRDTPPRRAPRPGAPDATTRVDRSPSPVHAPRARPLHPALRRPAGRRRGPPGSRRGADPDVRRRGRRDAHARRHPSLRRRRRRHPAGLSGRAPSAGLGRGRPARRGYQGSPKRSREVWSANGSRRGGPSRRAG